MVPGKPGDQVVLPQPLEDVAHVRRYPVAARLVAREGGAVEQDHARSRLGAQDRERGGRPRGSGTDHGDVEDPIHAHQDDGLSLMNPGQTGDMQIDKNQIVEFLKSRGDHSKAMEADEQLPDQVNTDQPSDLLARLGINPQELLGQLGGAGGIAGKLGLGS